MWKFFPTFLEAFSENLNFKDLSIGFFIFHQGKHNNRIAQLPTYIEKETDKTEKDFSPIGHCAKMTKWQFDDCLRVRGLKLMHFRQTFFHD